MVRWFSNLKIGLKLTLGFGLVLLLMLGTLATDVVVSTAQKAIADHLVDHLYPARQAAREIVTLARAADSDAGRYLLELDDQSRAATDLRTYEQEVQQIRQALAQANALADTDGQRQNIQAFTTFYFGKGGYYEGSEASFTLKRAGKFSLAFGHFADTPLAPSLHAADLYIVTVEREVAQETAAEGTASRLVLLLSLSLGGLATLLGIGISILIARSISRPLKQVEHAAQHLCRHDVANLASGLTALARGDLTATIQTSSIPPLYQSSDEIGQTAQAMRSIVADVRRTVDGYEVARRELQQLYGQLAEQNKTLQSLSTTDPLTGLPNHRTVMSRVEEELSRCRRTQASCAKPVGGSAAACAWKISWDATAGKNLPSCSRTLSRVKRTRSPSAYVPRWQKRRTRGRRRRRPPRWRSPSPQVSGSRSSRSMGARVRPCWRRRTTPCTLPNRPGAIASAWLVRRWRSCRRCSRKRAMGR